MDELIARIIGRLERSEKSWTGQGADSYARGVQHGFHSAAAIVREAWDDEQAKIAEQERADYVPTKAELLHSEDPDMYPDPWAEVRDLPPTVAWHEEGR